MKKSRNLGSDRVEHRGPGASHPRKKKARNFVSWFVAISKTNNLAQTFVVWCRTKPALIRLEQKNSYLIRLEGDYYSTSCIYSATALRSTCTI